MPLMTSDPYPLRTSAQPLAGTQCILVLGMHRSGTSALTRVLNLLGVELGQSFLPIHPDNPRGYWEHPGIVTLNDRLLAALDTTWEDPSPLPAHWWRAPELEWFRHELALTLQRDFGGFDVWGIKDPRLPRLLPLWLDVLQGLGADTRAILMVRHPLEVAASLSRRDGFSRAHSLILWLDALFLSEQYTRGLPRSCVTFDQLLGDWRSAIEAALAGLRLSVPLRIAAAAPSVDRFLDAALRHHHPPADADEDALLSLALQAFRDLSNASHGSEAALHRLAGMQADYRRASACLAPWFEDRRVLTGRLAEAQVRNAADRQAMITLETMAAGQRAELDRLRAGVAWDVFRLARWVERRVRRAGSYLNLGFLYAGPLLEMLALGALGSLRRPRRALRLATRVLRGDHEAQRMSVRQTVEVAAQAGPLYRSWVRRYDHLTDTERNTIRRHITELPRTPLISLVMPVYNPPERHLRSAIDSVRRQLYPHWELCIADDCSDSPTVATMIRKYAALDPRIRFFARSSRGHIAAASNSALALATGEFVGFLDHDDELSERALYMVARHIAENPSVDLLYTDEDKLDALGRRYDPYFKPDWSPDLLLSQNYLGHLAVYRTERVVALGGLRAGFEGSQDWDLALRFTEGLPSSHIAHIPHPLYHWRALPSSTASGVASKGYAVEAGRQAVQAHLERANLPAQVSAVDGGYLKVRYAVTAPAPLVSIVIPTRNRGDLLRRCVDSIRQRTTYAAYELVIIDNGSDEPETRGLLDELQRKSTARVIRYDGPFNYSALNNYAVHRCAGTVLTLLNNDVEVISPDWLEEMVGHALRSQVGAVGAMLLYPSGVIQHAGIVLGMGGVAGHAYLGYPRGTSGYFSRCRLTQNVSAVTAACLVVRRQAYEEVGGFDEVNLPVAFNDVDFCLRLRDAGYFNVWTPYARLYHHESATRGPDDSPEKLERFARDRAYMMARWGDALTLDPAYNPNLSLDHAYPRLAFPPRVRANRHAA